MNRDKTIDFLRCLMNYMIVLLHAWAAFQYVDRTTIEFKSWTTICSHVCWMALPTFFLVSGYLFYVNYEPRKYMDKLVRRLKRLFIPYLAWNILFVVFYLVMARCVPRLSARVATFGLNTVSGALSKIVSISVHPIDGPLWFSRALIFLVLLAPIFWLLLRVWRGALAIGLSVVWLFVAEYLGLSEKIRMILPTYSIACFLIGGVIAREGVSLTRFFRSWWFVAVGLVAVGLGSLPVWTGAIPLPWWIRTALPVFMAPALIALFGHFPLERIAQNHIYGFLRDMSFFAYAGHFLFCSMLLHTAAPCFDFMTTGKFTVLILIFCGLGVPLMAVVYWLGKRFMPKVMKIFDGTL